MKIIKLLLIFVLLAGNIVLLLNWNAVFKSGFKAERKEWEALMEQVVRLEVENGSLRNQLNAREAAAAAEAERQEAERLEAEKKAEEDARKKAAEADAKAYARDQILEMVNENKTITEIRNSVAWKLLTEKERITVENVAMDPKNKYSSERCTADNRIRLQKDVQKILDSKKPFSTFDDMKKTQSEIQIIEVNYHYAKK